MAERIKEYSIIRRATNQEVYRTQINKGSFVRYELMKTHYIQLNFSTDRAIYFRLGDYCVTEYGTFELTEQYIPTYNSRTGGYDYQLTLNATYWKWNNKVLLFMPNSGRFETAWTLTDTIDHHLAILTNNISYHGFGTYTVSILEGVDTTSAKMITYNGDHIIDALTNICKVFDCEWWIDGNIIKIGRCEHGTAVDFEIDVNVEKMSASEGSGDHATRIYPFGSTQNMPRNYRTGEEGVVVNGIAENRVMLPASYNKPYIQHSEVATEEEAIEAVVIFNEVYPHTDGTMSECTSEEKNLDDGNGGTETARIYRFKDSSIVFKSEYILENLQMVIQSGTMRGMTFDLVFNPDNKPETIDDGEGNTIMNPEAQVFEIVRNENYGPMLPNDDINPQKDIAAGKTVKYRLIGWDASKIAELGLIAAAETELLAKAQAYAEKLQMDSSTYTCTMRSDWAYGLDNNGQADRNYGHRYDIGQKVRLVNGNFFNGGQRLSRIVGFELKLDFEYDHPQYIVGEAPDYSRFGDIESKISDITFKSTNYTSSTNLSGGGASVYVIGTGDTTEPTDSNVFSARRSLQHFARKDKDDTISGLHRYQVSSSAERGIQSSDFNPGMFGTGFTVKRKANGRAVMETDELIVRIKAFFANLEIRELSYVGGNYLFSCAGSKLLRVEWLDENGAVLEQTSANRFVVHTFRCYFYQDNGTTATMNYWMIGDQARCQKFNIKPGVYQNVANKYYWRLVTGKGDDYIDLSATDCDYDSDFPEAEDSIVQLGFRGNDNDRRQGCIFLDVESENSPAIYEYSGINSYVLPEPTLQLSPKKNVIYGEFHSITDSGGSSVESIYEQILGILAEIQAIKNQADKKFEIWFGHGVPTASNYPAMEWVTNELKAVHVQDIYYDMDRSPGSKGGRAYRWVAEVTGEGANAVTTYKWVEITDQDTIDALEKIADVASDEVLTGGAEKTRVLVDWCKAEHEYWKYTEQARDYGLNDASYYAQGETNVYNAYVAAFLALGKYLNGNVDLTLESAGVYNTPSWLAGSNLQSDTQIASPDTYRSKWNEYYLTLATLLKAITKRAKELADAAQDAADEALSNLEKIASDGWLMPDEKIEVRREFIAAYKEMNDSGGILDKAMDDRGSYDYVNYNAHIKPYKDAFNALGTYLNGGTAWTSPATDPNDSTKWILPSWIDDSHMDAGVQISGDTFCSLWAAFYSARAVLLTELSKNAQTTAENAHGRIDDIANDGIISGGSEKSALLIHWQETVQQYLKYKEQAEDYEISVTAFENAYKAVANMLNGGSGSTAIYNGTTLPSWINATNISSDTTLSTYSLTPATYRNNWNAYYTQLALLIKAINVKAKELADAAQDAADEALEKIGDMANDGKLDPSEKLTVKREFIAAWNEKDKSEGVIDKCYDANDSAIIATATINAYINAFVALGTYLNGGTNWSAGSSMQNDTYRATDANLPSWIQSGNMSTTNSITGSTWRTKWSDFYSARTAVLTALSEAAKDAADNAQTAADNAQAELDNMANDNILTDKEKIAVLREWNAVYKEFSLITTAAAKAHVSYTDYSQYFYRLGNYLIDKTSYTYQRSGYNYSLPTMLVSSGDSAISGSTFSTYWSDYYKEKSNLLGRISNQHVNIFTGGNPTPPYKVGDYWIDNDGIEYVCIYSREAGESFGMSDWKDMRDMTEKRDPRFALSALAEKAYKYVSAYNSNSSVTLTWNGNAPSNYNNGDLWYNGANVYQRQSGSNYWVTISDTGLAAAFRAVDTCSETIGRDNVKLYGTLPSTNPRDYDLCAKTISFYDSFSQETIQGNVEILMYNSAYGWEQLKEATRALIENLGNQIRAFVFGSNGGTVASSGLLTKSNISQLFAQATDTNGKIITKAYLDVYTEDFVDEDGVKTIISGVKIKADKIDFESGTLKISAENINFVGKTVINGKFTVDSNGNVTMNNMTANQATIKDSNLTNVNISGNIFTPYTIINSSNITNYATLTQDAYSSYYLIDIDKAGLNIQIDIATLNPYTYIKFPTAAKWAGAEANIYANGYCVIRDLSTINIISGNSYTTWHPILMKGQKMKIKCIKDGSVYRWVPEFYTDIARKENPILIAQCYCEIGTYANGFSFSPSYKALFGSNGFTFERLGEGRYKVTKPSGWTNITLGYGGYPSMGDVYIEVNNLGFYYDEDHANFSHLKATLMEVEQNYFIVGVADDSSANDGSFGFSIWLTKRWNAVIF